MSKVIITDFRIECEVFPQLPKNISQKELLYFGGFFFFFLIFHGYGMNAESLYFEH